LKQFVVAGRLGRPLHTHAWTFATDIPWWAKHYVRAISGGGVLASTAVHILDLALWIADSPAPASASASMERVFPRKRGATAPSPVAAEEYDVEDMLAGHVRFTDGSWMTLEGAWAWDAPANSYSFEMVGERAAIQLEPARVVIEEDGAPVERTAALLGDLERLNNWPQSVTAHMGAVLTAVRRGEAPPVTMHEALRVQQLVDALYRSAETRREVVLAQ
jgi:predicted dehydrogenase